MFEQGCFGFVCVIFFVVKMGPLLYFFSSFGLKNVGILSAFSESVIRFAHSKECFW